MIFDKNWLNKEVYYLKRIMRRDKKFKMDNKIMLYFIFVISLVYCAILSGGDNFICPHCENSIEIEIQAAVKPGSWKCPNKNCGYENDNRMRYCSLCGSERQ